MDRKAQMRLIRQYIEQRAAQVNYVLQVLLWQQGGAMFADTLTGQVACCLYGGTPDTPIRPLLREAINFTMAALQKAGFLHYSQGPGRLAGLDVLSSTWLGQQFANHYWATMSEKDEEYSAGNIRKNVVALWANRIESC